MWRCRCVYRSVLEQTTLKLHIKESVLLSEHLRTIYIPIDNYSSRGCQLRIIPSIYASTRKETQMSTPHRTFLIRSISFLPRHLVKKFKPFRFQGPAFVIQITHLNSWSTLFQFNHALLIVGSQCFDHRWLSVGPQHSCDFLLEDEANITFK